MLSRSWRRPAAEACAELVEVKRIFTKRWREFVSLFYPELVLNDETFSPAQRILGGAMRLSFSLDPACFFGKIFIALFL